jgi:NADH-quinone oxidoreductase subunit H
MFESIFIEIAEGIRYWFLDLGTPELMTDIILMLIKLGAILGFLVINALWLVYMERNV